METVYMGGLIAANQSFLRRCCSVVTASSDIGSATPSGSPRWAAVSSFRFPEGSAPGAAATELLLARVGCLRPLDFVRQVESRAALEDRV